MKDKEVVESVELLWSTVQAKKGRSFTSTQLAHIAHYLSSLSILLMKHEQQAIEFEKIIQACADEHGSEPSAT